MLGTASFHTLADVREHAIAQGVPWWSVGPFAVDTETAGTDGTPEAALDPDATAVQALDAQEAESYRGDTPRALDDLAGWTSSGWRVVVVTEGHGLAQRVVEVLGEREVAARPVPSVDEVPEPAVVHVTTGSLGRGFVAPSAAASRWSPRPT